MGLVVVKKRFELNCCCRISNHKHSETDLSGPVCDYLVGHRATVAIKNTSFAALKISRNPLIGLAQICRSWLLSKKLE